MQPEAGASSAIVREAYILVADDVTVLKPNRSVLPTDPYASIAAFFDDFAPSERRWRRRNREYYGLVQRIARFLVLPNASVLEVGCGFGDLLAAVEPHRGVGIDVSDEMVAMARESHPQMEFHVTAGESLDLDETFDYILLSDTVPYVHDLLALFERLRAHSHAGTRVIVNSYSSLWRPAFAIAELLRLKPRKPVRNWVSPVDVENLLRLAGFEPVALTRRILMPKRVPLVSGALNGALANLWPFNHLCATWWIVARPVLDREDGSLSVSVVCPCRNEEGHIAELVERLPDFGAVTEIVFVEGNSTDRTRSEIERQIELHPEIDMRLVDQTRTGKGDAVRAGFAAARNDVLLILDGDLSVMPEDLPKFCRALQEGRGELVNGSRLVYDIEPGAMRFLNMVGNKLFSRAFKGITGQHVTDTLCGTKALRRSNYEKIASGRTYFGEFDPFGDFDLLFGAARLGLKIVDLPVRYHPRRYGTSNISRWRHGLLLLRMTTFALWKFRVAIYRPTNA